MTGHSPRLLIPVQWVILVLLAASVTFTPIRADNDCWWHVKTGKIITEQGIPKHDVFAFTAAEHPWDNHEWLSQMAMWQAWRLGDQAGFGGWRAVILLTTLVSVAAWSVVALLLYRRVRRWGVALLLAVLAVAIGRRTLYPRPPVVSYLLFALVLWICYEVRLGRWPRKRLWVLVPLTALWSNLHGGWMAGLAAMGMFAVDGFARFTLAWWKGLWSEDRKAERAHLEIRSNRAFGDARGFAIVLLLCAGAACANPFGWRLYLLPGRVMKDLWLVRSIGELLSPDFYYTVAFEIALLLTVAGLALVRRRPVTLVDVLLFLFWGHQGLQHVRHLPMFAIGAAPLMGVVARESLRDLHCSLAGRQFGLERWSWLPLAAILLALMVYVEINPREGQTYPSRNRALLRGVEYVENNFPTRACDFAILSDLQGRLFNRNNYAGYLIWRLSPEQAQVFSDSRFDIFGSKFLRDEELIGRGDEDPARGKTWKEGLEQWGIDWVLIPNTEGLNTRLAESKDWEFAYRDPTGQTPWVIWIRKSEKTQDMRERARRVYSTLPGGPP